MTKIAIIGTAGRDKTKPMTRALWEWMIQHAKEHVPSGAHVVSGGAAWADHLAVELFLRSHANEITLYLPAPFRVGKFAGPYRSAASAANYYHELFSKAAGFDSLADIECLVQSGSNNVHGGFEPEAEGYGAMFARNLKVARDAEDGVLAYTFGTGNIPADGGTKDTWDKCRCSTKMHVTLPINL